MAETVNDDANDVSSTSAPQTRPSGWTQLLALMRKNFLIKLRSPAGTLFELFSPVAFMLLLAYAFTLAEVKTRNEKMYATISIDFPGPWVGLAQQVTNLANMFDDSNNLLTRRNLFEDVHYDIDNDNDDITSWDSIFTGLDEKRESIMKKRVTMVPFHEQPWNSTSRKLQQFRNPTDSSDDEMADSYLLLDDIRKQLRKLLKGPIQTPSFSQFVQASRGLSSAIGVENLPRVFAEASYGLEWGNLLTLGTLHLSPNNEVTQDFWKYLNETYPLVTNSVEMNDASININSTKRSNGNSFRIRVHDSEDLAIQYIDENNLNERAWALLDFSEFDPTIQDVNAYKIRLNITTLPNTARVTNWVTLGLNTRYQRYFLSGYMTLQRTINEFAFSRSDGCQTEDVSSLTSMPMPTAAYNQNPFFMQVGYLLGLTMVMAFLYPVSRLIKQIVEEKESRMKETLLILGVSGWAHWLSWLITSLIVFSVITLTVSFTLTGTLLKYSNAVYILLYVFFFSTSTVGFCFTVSSFFSRAKLAGIIGPVALFTTILPRFIFFGSNRYEQISAKRASSILPATAFCFGADIIADYEYSEKGIQAWNASEGDYSFNTCLGFLIFDTILFILLGWYFDKVIPQQYGAAQPFYFLFLPSYWCNKSINQSPGGQEHEQSKETSSDIEEVLDEHLVAKVFVNDLVKQYHTGKTEYPPAVDGLNLTMYESQITALLGHNGAGKTTTVSLMTGLISPTDGDCILYGKSIVRSKNEARMSIGICPQHNVLFDDLTVYEHIFFFMKIKGITPSPDIIKIHADEIGLSDYLGTTSSALSGGNKRKLSVAIALSGNPDVLILDEPTSAMDPHSRRAVWDLLRQKKKGRVTVLTTHFMDEAELLSDRIAVMKEGKLRCCGSPIFLKDRFGLGYSITVVLEPRCLPIEDEENGSTESAHGFENGDVDHHDAFKTQRKHLFEFLNKRIPNTKLIRTSGKEVTFRFPQGTESMFRSTLDDLEVERDLLGIGAYGIQNSSLEEVFLQLADDDFGLEDHEQKVQEKETTWNYDGEYAHLSPFRQIGLLYWKRFTIQKRDKKGACFAIILPVLVIALVLLILMIELSFLGQSLQIDPGMYEDSSTNNDSSITTTVAIGGKASTTASSFEEEFKITADSIHNHYRNVDFISTPNASTSMDMSKYLLETYNDRNHATRFGAYVLNDSVDLSINFDSSALQEIPNTTVYDLIDLITSLGIGDDNGALTFSIDFPTLPEAISELPGIPQDLTVNVTDLVTMWDELIFLTRVFTNVTINIPSRASILHNSSSPHAVAAFNQAYMEYIYGQCKSSSSARLISINEPLPLTTQQAIEVRTILSTVAALFLLIPYCYIPGAFIVFLVKERVSKSKHLQLVSGTNMTSYWFATYLWDLTLFFIITVLIMIIFLLYGNESAQVFVGDLESFLATATLTFGYGTSVLPFSYLLSRSFINPSSAQISVVGLVFVTGFIAVNAYFIMSTIEDTAEVAESLRPFFRLWPAYNVGEGFIALAGAYWAREVLFLETAPFDWEVTGISIALLFGLAPVYFLILLFLEYAADGGSGGSAGRILRRIKGYYDRTMLSLFGVKRIDDNLELAGSIPNEDLQMESEYVKSNEDLKASVPVLLKDLWKIYPPSAGILTGIVGSLKWFICACGLGSSRCFTSDNKGMSKPRRAVRGVTAAVQRGETFGLLGANGAGKTTTLNMLTGDIAPTGGEAYVAGHDITGVTLGGVAKARQKIGFCPQIDPLLGLMTGRETLAMFARLRGIPYDKIEEATNDLLTDLTLTAHADKVADSYSGGNKRKLSLGIASLVGDGGVLLIDECSSGLDPLARKKLWGLIERLAIQRSVIITTHSMEEAEALCSRIGIMAQGQFVALGTVQYLKTKYLDGYNIEICCRSDATEEAIDTVVSNILQDVVPGSIVTERYGRFIKFELSKASSIGLGSTFHKLQTLKESDHAVENYSLSQCSLEQVFIKLIEEA